MTRRKRYLVPVPFLVVFWLIAWEVEGALEFKTLEAEHQAKAEDDVFNVVFPFVNRGDEPVRITKIESSCGCLKAEVSAKVIAPGEEGVVKGLFNLGAATGENEKYLTVRTDEKGAEPYELVTRVLVPEIVTIDPKILSWGIGEEPEERIFEFKVKREEPIRVVDVSSSRREFALEWETIEEGRRYRIKLKPETTEKALLG
ncbi:MAG: DUF1573 domain-containing protein, partial [Verrucomicrobiota bacterium]